MPESESTSFAIRHLVPHEEAPSHHSHYNGLRPPVSHESYPSVSQLPRNLEGYEVSRISRAKRGVGYSCYWDRGIVLVGYGAMALHEYSAGFRNKGPDEDVNSYAPEEFFARYRRL